MANKAIEVLEVSKSYKGAKSLAPIKALEKVSFEVESGEIFGLIGPDGSGKSTMMRIVASLILPDSGSVVLNGLDIVNNYKKVRNSIGYMPGRFSLYQDLTVEENLKFFAKIFGVKISENIDLINRIYSQIAPFKNRLAGRLSGGMKQKLALCCALIHRPIVLILDEPTTGVDPVSRQELWDILSEMKKQGMAILASTPYMDEAVRCDKISFIAKGRILESGSPREITQNFSKKILHIKDENMFSLLNVVRKSPQISAAYAFGDKNHACLKSGNKEELLNYLSKNGHPEALVEEATASLEDRFMDLTYAED